MASYLWPTFGYKTEEVKKSEEMKNEEMKDDAKWTDVVNDGAVDQSTFKIIEEDDYKEVKEKEKELDFDGVFGDKGVEATANVGVLIDLETAIIPVPISIQKTETETVVSPKVTQAPIYPIGHTRGRLWCNPYKNYSRTSAVDMFLKRYNVKYASVEDMYEENKQVLEPKYGSLAGFNSSLSQQDRIAPNLGCLSIDQKMLLDLIVIHGCKDQKVVAMARGELNYY